MGVSSGEVGALTDSIFGSSTHGGATDGPRPDMENGLGTITGELRVTNKAGPDVDPDSDAAGGFSGTVTGPPPDSGFTDGPRPELDEFIAKPDGPPKDDGVDPYAATESDGTGPASGGTREGGAPPPPPDADKNVMGGDTVSSSRFSGTLSPGGNPPSGGGTFTHEIDATAPDFSAAQMDVAIANPSLDMDDNAPPDDGFDQDADAGFGGPLDDDFT